MAHPSFSRSTESHGSNHSSDRSWRRQGTVTSEDIGTQTENLAANSGSTTSSGKSRFADARRRRDDTIVDISIETMKYNGGKIHPSLLASVERERVPEFDLARQRSFLSVNEPV